MELHFLYVKAKNTGIRYLSFAIIKKVAVQEQHDGQIWKLLQRILLTTTARSLQKQK